MKTVDLSCATELGLVAIVLAQTGVTYTNQTAGLMCKHPTAEGFLVPVRHSWDTGSDSLTDEYSPAAPCQTLPEYSTSQEYRLGRVSAWLRERGLDDLFEARDGDLFEAWIPVRIRNGAGYYPLRELVGLDAVLTYDNSD